VSSRVFWGCKILSFRSLLNESLINQGRIVMQFMKCLILALFSLKKVDITAFKVKNIFGRLILMMKIRQRTNY